MAVLALVTAEFLVCPAVPDLVSALKALWHMPFYVLSVIHRPNFSSNVKTPPLTCNMQTEILLFLRQCFSFFYNFYSLLKLILYRMIFFYNERKIFTDVKNRKNLKKQKK